MYRDSGCAYVRESLPACPHAGIHDRTVRVIFKGTDNSLTDKSAAVTATDDDCGGDDDVSPVTAIAMQHRRLILRTQVDRTKGLYEITPVRQKSVPDHRQRA